MSESRRRGLLAGMIGDRFEELDGLPEVTRLRIIQQARLKVYREHRVRYWIFLGGTFIAGPIYGLVLLNTPSGWTFRWIVSVAFFAVLILLIIFAPKMGRKRMRRAIREILVAGDV